METLKTAYDDFKGKGLFLFNSTLLRRRQKRDGKRRIGEGQKTDVEGPNSSVPWTEEELGTSERGTSRGRERRTHETELQNRAPEKTKYCRTVYFVRTEDFS